jgi:predicted DNA-binding transcriptional regulator AlpA
MNLLTIDDIAEMFKLSRTYTLNVIVKQPNFPQPVIGVRKPRWDSSAVNKHLKFPQKANNAQ